MKLITGAIHTGKKVFVVVIHIAVAYGLTDILAILMHNPNLQKYWPVMNVLQVALLKGIEYYNLHKDDFQLPE